MAESNGNVGNLRMAGYRPGLTLAPVLVSKMVVYL